MSGFQGAGGCSLHLLRGNHLMVNSVRWPHVSRGLPRESRGYVRNAREGCGQPCIRKARVKNGSRASRSPSGSSRTHHGLLIEGSSASRPLNVVSRHPHADERLLATPTRRALYRGAHFERHRDAPRIRALATDELNINIDININRRAHRTWMLWDGQLDVLGCSLAVSRWHPTAKRGHRYRRRPSGSAGGGLPFGRGVSDRADGGLPTCKRRSV